MSRPQSKASIAGHPIHPMLVPFPIAFFIGALLCDLTFWNNANLIWFTASEWLLGAGLVMSGLAAIAGLTDFFSERLIRNLNVAWWHAGLNIIMVLIELYNFYVRYTLGPSAVLYSGLVMSVISVIIIAITGWLGGEMVYRHGVGVTDTPSDRIVRPDRKGYEITEEEEFNYQKDRRPPTQPENRPH